MHPWIYLIKFYQRDSQLNGLRLHRQVLLIAADSIYPAPPPPLLLETTSRFSSVTPFFKTRFNLLFSFLFSPSSSCSSFNATATRKRPRLDRIPINTKAISLVYFRPLDSTLKSSWNFFFSTDAVNPTRTFHCFLLNFHSVYKIWNNYVFIKLSVEISTGQPTVLAKYLYYLFSLNRNHGN